MTAKGDQVSALTSLDPGQQALFVDALQLRWLPSTNALDGSARGLKEWVGRRVM